MMELPVIKIGNSKGIRLSKTILDKYEIKDTLEVILEKEQLVLIPKKKARKGWDKAFKLMHARGDDRLMIPDVFTDETLEEWK